MQFFPIWKNNLSWIAQIFQALLLINSASNIRGRTPFHFRPIRIPIFICIIISTSCTRYILSWKRGHPLIRTSRRAQKEGNDSVGINFHVKKNTRKMVLISKERVDSNGIRDADINVECPSQKCLAAQKKISSILFVILIIISIARIKSANTLSVFSC